jgi:hypothetical protein
MPLLTATAFPIGENIILHTVKSYRDEYLSFTGASGYKQFYRATD